MDPFKDQVTKTLTQLITKENYPCVAAIQSINKQDFLVHTYKKFGQLHQRPALRNDLLAYLKRFKETRSTYFTFFAAFEDEKHLSEAEFEQNLWNELSSLTSETTRQPDQDPRFSDDPNSQKFCFSLAGHAFFVVGLHPQSSRLSRQFPWPTLIFNVFEQFNQLAAVGKYESMVQLNRARDSRFQESPNPMALKYGEQWESIQFSGKENNSEWKCPFHFRTP